MAAENFKQIMAWLAGYEGGFVDDPDDPGGATNRGITQAVYDAYRRARGVHRRGVRFLNDREHDEIYRAQYWSKVWGDALPAGVDAAVFDYGVHSGTGRAVKVLQRIVGAKPVDGGMGLKTMAETRAYVDKFGAPQLVREICEERLAFMRGRAVWWKYKNGWTRRVMGQHAGAQDDDLGVLDRATMLTRNSPNLTKNILPPIKPSRGRATGRRSRLDIFRRFIPKWRG